MKNWSISYEAIDMQKSKLDVIRLTAYFSKEKWYRDAMKRNVLFFGVSRTLPAVERRDLSKFTNKNVVFAQDEIQVLGEEAAKHISKVLGKDVSAYAVVQSDKFGNISLLTGETKDGKRYSEFHFGAGESSIIKMVLGIEKADSQSLVLIEEIENGLHPLATARLIDYLLDVALRKNIQVIFTTHSEYALAPLPANAVWAAVDGTAIQGKLDIKSLRSLTGEVNSELIIYVEDEFVRATLGGTGFAKCGGNYAGSLAAQVKAEKLGYSQVLWLDGVHRKYVEEVGSMNVMFEVDNTIITAPTDGTVLPGVTRDSILHILRDWGYKVEEKHFAIDDLMKAGHEGRLQEAWGTGTAAVISPIGELYFKGDIVTINDFKTGELTQKIYDTLTGIQWGDLEDKYGWTYEVKID